MSETRRRVDQGTSSPNINDNYLDIGDDGKTNNRLKAFGMGQMKKQQS